MTISKSSKKDIHQSCITCLKYWSCKKVEKKDGQGCYEYLSKDTVERQVTSESSTKSINSSIDKIKIYTEQDLNEADDDLSNYFSPTSYGLNLPEQDFPLAKNLHEFVFSRKFLNLGTTGLYARQFGIGLNLFTDYCPKCSDLEYLKKNFEVADTIDKVLERVVLFEHDICPKCKSSKLDLISENQSWDNWELAALCGQRCIVGDSYVYTDDGLKQIKTFTNNKVGFSDYVNIDKVLTTEGYLTPTKFFEAAPEQMHMMTTKHGFTITGTAEHPIMTQDGFKKLKDIKTTDCVFIQVGQECFGKNSIDLEQACLNTNKTFMELPRTEIKGVVQPPADLERFYRMIGYWVSEGTGGELSISNNDQEVLSDIRESFKEVFKGSSRLIRELSCGIGVLNKLGSTFLKEVLTEECFNTKSLTKKIPSFIFTSPRHLQLEFLKALFEGDGGVENLKKKPTVTYCSISKELVAQLHLLLSNLGIATYRTSHKAFARNGTEKQVAKEAYIIHIQGYEQLKKFSETIGFFSTRKKQRLDEALKQLKASQLKKIPHWYEKYPDCIKQEYVGILKEVQQQVTTLKRGKNSVLNCSFFAYLNIQSNNGFCRIFDNNVALTKERLRWNYELIKTHPYRELVAPILMQKLDDFINIYLVENIIFEPVLSVEETTNEKTYDFYLPPTHTFIANSIINHNSGKSLMAAIFSAYTLHRFLKLPSVAEAFEVAKPTIFLGTFVALDKSQIQDSTWGYLINLIKDTPWFVSYCTMLRDYGRRAGRKLVDVEKVETIEFYCKNIKLNMAAPRPGALRGRTGFLGVVDEIGFLKAKDGEGRVITADEVYASLNNRMGTLVTAFEKKRLITPNLPTPLFINISSPSHARDKICSLVKGITEQNSIEKDIRHLRRYAVTYPTWEINPMFPKESSYISSKYRTDPKEAERDFGAKPPLSENSFIEDVVTLRENFTSRSNLIELEYELGNKHTDYKIKFLREDFNRSVPRVLTLDLGFNNNSTGFSVGHYDESSSKVIVDILGEIIPINGAEVNFVLFLEKVVKPLIAALNIKIVSADRWQSISLMQDLEMNYKIKAVTYSLKYGDFLFYKQGLMNHRIEYPQTEDASLLISCPPEEYPKAYYNKPVSHFFFQCLTVVDEKDKTVRKGDKTTDDIFRATALLHYILTNLEYRDFLKNSGRASIPSGPVAHVQSIRGGTLSSQGGTPRFSGATVVVV